jgi:ribosome-associated protein
MDGDLVINDQLTIPAGELHYTYARSSGPGGQNVNKTSTKVVLRWNVTASQAISGGVRGRFLARWATRISFWCRAISSANSRPTAARARRGSAR